MSAAAPTALTQQEGQLVQRTEVAVPGPGACTSLLCFHGLLGCCPVLPSMTTLNGVRLCPSLKLILI